MKVRVSGDAAAYIRREAAYLQRHSPAAARSFLTRMSRARETLARFPDIGMGPNRLPIAGSHRLVVGDYLLDYDVDAEEVLVTSIRHGAQEPSPTDLDDDFDYEA